MITDIIDHVSFRGERLTLVWQNEEPFVAIRPICERLGLAWQPQQRRLSAPENGFSCHPMVSTGADGKRYEMLCLHAVEMPLWLASISPSRVKPELREALIAYRSECSLVLFQHVKARLLGERQEALDFALRCRMILLTRKPLWVKIEAYARMGWGFHAIWRGCATPRHRVAEAIQDLFRLGVIERIPEDTPMTQLDMFPPAKAPVTPLPGIDEMIERSI